MNSRLPRAAEVFAAASASSPAEDRRREAAAIRVDRAGTELRRGRPLLIADEVENLDSPERAPACAGLLVAAIETLAPRDLVDFERLGAPLGLLLSGERLQSVGIAAPSPRWLPLNGPLTVDELQRLAAVLPDDDTARISRRLGARGHDAGELDVPGEAASAAMLAGLALCKRGRLTPALLVMKLAAPPARSLDEAPWLRIAAADVALALPAQAGVLRRVSDARVPIAAHEDCTLTLFREVDGDAEHVAITVGQPAPGEPVAVRLHSSCLTGDLLGSLRCDCGDQLKRAIEHLAEAGGVLLYLAQEGRGTGLGNKLRAYRLQDGGLDTLQADRHLGFREDERDFRAAAAMLHALGHNPIRLLTNNPQKIDALRRAGIDVVGRLPLAAPVNEHNARYILTKQEQAGHWRVDEAG